MFQNLRSDPLFKCRDSEYELLNADDYARFLILCVNFPFHLKTGLDHTSRNVVIFFTTERQQQTLNFILITNARILFENENITKNFNCTVIFSLFRFFILLDNIMPYVFWELRDF